MLRPDGRFTKKASSDSQRLYLRHCSNYRRKLRNEPWNYVAADRLRKAVAAWGAEIERANDIPWGWEGSGYQALLASKMKRSTRQVYRYLAERPVYNAPRANRRWLTLDGGAYKAISVYVLDEFLTAMERTHLLLLPPEQGGFADVYLHPDMPVGDEVAVAA